MSQPAKYFAEKCSDCLSDCFGTTYQYNVIPQTTNSHDLCKEFASSYGYTRAKNVVLEIVRCFQLEIRGLDISNDCCFNVGMPEMTCTSGKSSIKRPSLMMSMLFV